MYNALNHSNETCHNLLHKKLNCMHSTFKENYQYFFYKYQLSDSDGYNNLEHLLRKVKIKYICVRSVIDIERIYSIYYCFIV